jgi:two-component system cell cycle sensor histidine kinase/response regulator CckA
MTRVLIVDDKEENLYYLQALLTGHGWSVDTARHGAEALVKARHHPPDLVVSDLLMPVMDGYTLLRHWKADDRLRHAPFIVYTATYTEPEDERLALSLGADAFILKPAEPDDFLARIREAQTRAAQPGSPPPSTPVGDEGELLKGYSETLIRKLEEKTLQLEETNHALEQDIAKRRQAEDSLRSSEARLRAIFESEPECVKIVSKDGQLLEMNPAGLRMIEAGDREAVIGRPILPFIHADDQKAFMELHDRVCQGETGQLQFRLIGLKGTQRWMDTHATPLRADDGKITAVLSITRDITERRRAETAVRESEERFRLLIENASDLITVVNHQGVIRYQSPASQQSLGYAPEELLGRKVFEFIHPDDASATTAALQRAWATSATPVSVEYRFRHRNGHWCTLQSVGRNIPGQTEEGFVIVNSRDITETRLLEEQFRQSQKMEAIGQLAGGVAHDFNNILAVMMMQAELTAMVENLPEEVREGLREIRAAAERAANLTSQLLLFSRRQVMRPRELDLNEVVSGLTKMLQRLIGEDVRLQLLAHPVPLLTRADPGMLDQLLLNLAVNARDAMPAGGRLIIETAEKTVDETIARLHPDARPGRYVWLSVTDSGRGIPPELLPRIFEPFFTTKDPGKGTGLGLATVFGIIKQHRGWIKVYSEPGHGTNFQIFLPASAAVSADVAPAAPAKPRGGTETILVAEDDPAVRLLTRAILERRGYRVLEAANGVEALDLWPKHREQIALLLTDMVMPAGMSGQQLARRLQQDNPRLKVVFISGYSAETAGREIELNSGQNFVQKPFPPDQLLETVRRCLDS